jgi:anti-sigma-K factor RskA
MREGATVGVAEGGAMKHSRPMWSCIAIVAAVAVLAVAFNAPLYLVILVPCIAMVIAMVWMGESGRSGGR